MNHKTHTYLMIGSVVVGAVLFFTGALDGGGLLLLWPLACVAMMVAMMWGTGGMSHGSREHTHDDGVTHSHEDTPVQPRS